MEIPIYLFLIFLFLWMIYNHFFQIEGMECDLGTNFKKKSPDQVKSLSSEEKTTYTCQLKKYKEKLEGQTHLKLALRQTKKLLPIIKKPIASIEKKFNELKDTYAKWQESKTTRDDAIDNLYKFVDEKEEEKPGGNNGHCDENPATCEEVDACKADKTLCKGQDAVIKSGGKDGKPMLTSFENE
jgi:hypothetical protein